CSWRRSRFFVQADDGIRGLIVTGVQTCALPISTGGSTTGAGDRATTGAGPRILFVGSGLIYGEARGPDEAQDERTELRPSSPYEIGRASCRERVKSTGVDDGGEVRD